MKTGTNLQLANAFRKTNATKADRKEFVYQIIAAIEGGEVDIIELHANVKNAESIIKQLTGHASYKDSLLDAVQKAGKEYQAYNAQFDVTETGVKYDFMVCNDALMSSLLLQKEGLDKKIKTRETFLRAVPVSGAVITDEDTGETCKVFPPNKTSTTSVAVTLL
jgi:hypothetical protein